jgi:hypothetical protein
VDKTCLGLVSNAGQTKLGLRMSEHDLTSPAAFTTGLVKSTIDGAITPNLVSCNLNGNGTYSWLLQFDTQTMTLKTGGARPVADPTQGYSFDDETIDGFHVQPVTFNGVAPDANGHFSVTQGADLVMPIFLNSTGTVAVVLPIHQARLLNGQLSSNDDCIGSYNAAGLDPANGCGPDGTHPQFIDAASLDGYILLAEADQVIIASLNQSLCVLLSGSSSMYGAPPAQPGGPTLCKRDGNGKILYQGGWCSTTNMASTSTCADAEQLKGNFAASSVKILN